MTRRILRLIAEEDAVYHVGVRAGRPNSTKSWQAGSFSMPCSPATRHRGKCKFHQHSSVSFRTRSGHRHESDPWRAGLRLHRKTTSGSTEANQLKQKRRGGAGNPRPNGLAGPPADGYRRLKSLRVSPYVGRRCTQYPNAMLLLVVSRRAKGQGLPIPHG